MTATLAHDTQLRLNDLPQSLKVRPRAKWRSKLAANTGLVVLGVAFILPLLWVLLAAFDSHATAGIELPHLSLSNFTASLSGSHSAALVNSLIMSIIATFISTVPAAFAAYGLSRYRLPLKRTILIGILFLSGLPISIVVIPVYQFFSDHGFLTLVPTSLFLGVTSLPIEIWLIKSYIDVLPIDLEEAARVEGASTLAIFNRVVVPITLPGILAAALFGFINAWGSLLIPLLLVADPNQAPAALVFPEFTSATSIEYGQIAAYSIVYTLPVVILFLLVVTIFRGRFTLAGASG